MKFELQNFKPFKNKSGIYKITMNDHIYIGSSKNLANRLRYHYHSLRKGIHFNFKLQAIYNKHKEICEFEIAEYCEVEVLLKKETYYIQYFNADVNIIKDPSNVIWTTESSQKLTSSLKKYYTTHKPVNEKIVYMYSLDGKFITKYRSASEAGRIHNVDVGAIASAIKYKKPSVGFQWSYEFVDSLPKSSKNYQKVRQLDINGNVIKTWESIYEAAWELLVDVHLIKSAIRNKNIFLNSYWKTWTPFIPKPKEEWKDVGRKVYQYDLDGNFINEYKCVNEASRQTGINNHAISSNALKSNTYNKSAGGYQWSYEKVDKMSKYINNSDKAKIVPVIIFNVLTGEENNFNSIADAVRFIDGFYTDSAAATISHIANNGGFYKQYIATRTAYKLPNRKIGIYNIKLNKLFTDSKAAAFYSGISKEKIRNYCKDINNSEWLYLVDCARQKLRESGKIFE